MRRSVIKSLIYLPLTGKTARKRYVNRLLKNLISDEKIEHLIKRLSSDVVNLYLSEKNLLTALHIEAFKTAKTIHELIYRKVNYGRLIGNIIQQQTDCITTLGIITLMMQNSMETRQVVPTRRTIIIKKDRITSVYLKNWLTEPLTQRLFTIAIV